MGNEALQALSKKYARGQISKPEYRLLRKNIIDEVTGPGQANSMEPQEPANNHRPGPTGLASNTFLKAGVISAAIVVILILAYVSF